MAFLVTMVNVLQRYLTDAMVHETALMEAMKTTAVRLVIVT